MTRQHRNRLLELECEFGLPYLAFSGLNYNHLFGGAGTIPLLTPARADDIILPLCNYLRMVVIKEWCPKVLAFPGSNIWKRFGLWSRRHRVQPYEAE